jgi:DNA-binding transcriptional regulator LsrR (DeoR family)
MPRRTPIPHELVRDETLVALCRRFLEGATADELATWLLTQDSRFDVGRQRVYDLVREAARRGLIRLQVRDAEELQKRLAATVGVAEDRVRVAAASGRGAAEQVALVGAEMALALIAELAAAREGELVRVGLGGGHTLRLLADQLARSLRAAPVATRLAVHALSSGFDARAPQDAPITFLGAFEPVAEELVGLFSSGVLEPREAKEFRALPGVREAFQLANKLDLIVTSLGSARDETGALNRFFAHGAHPKLEESRRRLEARGWVGDVLYEPYGATAPIEADLPVEPVSVLTLPKLVGMARGEHKHVLLLAGPSSGGRSRADALRPLLTQPRLRLWTHLALDSGTAEQILNELE